MNHKSIIPNPQQPVDRKPASQLPSALAELSEAALTEANVLHSGRYCLGGLGIEQCSWDGDDA
jgi:bacteriocin leader peptide (microcyclamide/patellamide family)